jgi:hypothetical protein
MENIFPQGIFTAAVIDKGLGRSSKGTAQVFVSFQAKDGEAAGQTIAWYGSFSDAALPYTMEKLRTTGFAGDDLSDISSVGSAGDVQIVVAHEKYEGKIRAKVQFINALGGARLANPMDDADKRRFAAEMRSKIAALGASSRAAPKPAAPARAQDRRPEPPHSDDIPF